MISLSTLFEISKHISEKLQKTDVDKMLLIIRVTEDEFKKINEDCFLRLVSDKDKENNIPIYDEINMKIGLLNIKYEIISDE